MDKNEPDYISDSYKKRIEVLKERGVNTELLVSDWCVDCFHSDKIVGPSPVNPLLTEQGGQPYGTCGTGCNGIVPFRVVNGEREFIKGRTPLKYMKESGVEVEL